MSPPRFAHPDRLCPSAGAGCRSAFTLVELLVVIVIIAILAALSLSVGGRVLSGGKQGQTENVLRLLDATLTEYLSDRESKFPSAYVDPTGQSFPIIDGRRIGRTLGPGIAAGDKDFDFADPSMALYLAIVREVPAVDATLKSIDAKFVSTEQFDPNRKLSDRGVQFAYNRSWPNDDLPPNPLPNDPFTRRIRTWSGVPMVSANNPVQGLFINDAWNRPIRFVVPANHGGHGRFWDGTAMRSDRDPRTVNTITGPEDYSRSYRPLDPTTADANAGGDADEGLCPGGRPYFYSAGPDGDPGTREDNVYSITPRFPLETATLK